MMKSWAAVGAACLLLLAADAHQGITPRPSRAIPKRYCGRLRGGTSAMNVDAGTKSLIFNKIRGGSSDLASKTPATDGSKNRKRKLSHKPQIGKHYASKESQIQNAGRKCKDIHDPNIVVQSILIPRQTSILTPLRFLSFLLMNVSLSACMQSSGKPLEEAVRRILNMPTPETNAFASKVTPLHIYVAKKIVASSSSSSSTPSEMLPPGHLPSPLPLLALFLSILLYAGGTALLPRWNVKVDVFLNYVQYDVMHEDQKQYIDNACYALQNWFDGTDGNEMDPYYASKKISTPAVLVYEVETQKTSVCPLFHSPGSHSYSEPGHDSEHPRQYYFELDQKRYYYDPMHSANDNSQLPAVVSGGPSLHETAPVTLLSNTYTRGLQSIARLSNAQERYAPYSDISIPVPSLQSALAQRITSPLVSLQLIGRLLSLVEEENIGRALTNLARLGIEHFFDAKRSIAAASTLAEEVKDIGKSGKDARGNKSRFWAIRPSDATTTDNAEEDEEAKAEWVQVSPKDLLPGDVFVIAHSRASHSLAIPVDALLLEGTCVTEEAALTGESVPQAKVPLDTAGDASSCLDMNGAHRSSCIFAGTTMLHSSNWDEGTASSSRSMFNLPPLPIETFTDNTLPAMFLTLRTGSYSSRGEIIQSLLKSRMHMGISSRKNEVESIRLMGVLALFAVGACLFLFIDNSDSRQRDSVFKRMVQCTRIAVAAVPSDLPASLSSCAFACAAILRDEYDAVNSEPGALLQSSMVDTIVFDKTGTLTADTQALTTIVFPPPGPGTNKDSQEILSNIVLAGGHSLVGMDNDGNEGNQNLVGDPLDLACLLHSNWKYDAHEKSATSPDSTMKLWQIRSFPFDPIKKMSSAIVLVQSAGSFQLWVVAKGSPNELHDLVEKGRPTDSWYDDNIKRLGKLGYRSVGLGVLDVTDTKAAKALFPSGLPSPNESSRSLETRIHAARSHARSSLVRNDLERQSSSILNREKMAFAGFACFSAPMRTSSPKVVNELKSSGNDIVMLTGDEPYASLVVAKKTGIINDKQSKLCLLKTNESGLVWEINNKMQQFSLKSAKKVRQDVMNMQAALVVSGDAVNALLLGRSMDKAAQFVQNELLPKSSVIASASPKDKCIFIRWLQSECNRNVLMCGDGVNDISAMKESAVSVAMLSGFGHSLDDKSAKDSEDIRRKERLSKRYIGSNRRYANQSKQSILDDAGVGDSIIATCVRIQKGIEEGTKKLQSEDKDVPQHTTPFEICVSAIKDEIQRRRDLKKGGSNAAKILAEEDRLRMSLQNKANLLNSTVQAVEEIRTGESCLASSFTLLRPCISGVESILRTGVSAAACWISLYRKVALNCMLSCYNLATLYKNGLRYGSKMWQIELWSSISADQASFAASSSPRPRLVCNVRPSTTPFHASEVLSTMSHAIIHIVTLTCAVNLGKQLEEKYPTKSTHNGFNIKYSDSSNSASAGSLLASLVGSSESSSLHSDTGAQPQGFFRKSPFQPNYIANNVFIMSVFQDAVTTMVNHSGRPFSVGFLESRQLCLSACLAFLLCIVCIAESIPTFNRFIQLAPYPTKSSKIAMLRLLLLNVSMSYLASYFSTFFLRHDIWRERNKSICKSNLVWAADRSSTSAATEEEILLAEEREQNSKIVSVICFLIFLFSIQILN